MRETMFVRSLLGLAVLTLLAATALAQDNKSVITINGGKTVVMMKAPSPVVNHKNKPPCLAAGFYDNYQPAGCTYQAGIGWTISDGAPLNIEYTPANQIVSLKTGFTKLIKVGVTFVAGQDAAIVILDKDCNGGPCGIIDKTYLCRGLIKGMPNFGTTNTILETIKCGAQLVKHRPYWVYIQSFPDSDLAWNYSNLALGGFVEGTNDVWGGPLNAQPVGALQIF